MENVTFCLHQQSPLPGGKGLCWTFLNTEECPTCLCDEIVIRESFPWFECESLCLI